MIIVYNPETQLPIYSINEPYPEGTELYYESLSLQDPSFIWGKVEGNFSIIDKYVEIVNAQVLNLLDRTYIPIQVGNTEISVGEDFTIQNIPSNTRVTLGEESWVVDDGEFTFSSDVQGSYLITLELLPYLDTQYTVVFQ